MAEIELVWTEVDSSNVKAVAYDENSTTLAVKFNDNAIYSYDGVEHDIYVSLVHAPSVGRYLAMMIKGMYPYTKWSSELSLLDDLASK